MQKSVADVPDGVFKPIEVVVEEWEKIIIDYFLVCLVAEQTISIPDTILNQIHQYLSQSDFEFERIVRKNVWETDHLKWFGLFKNKNNKLSDVYIGKNEILDLIENYLKETKRKAIIIFDSLDEYEVGTKIFDRTIGALLRFINEFNPKYARIMIKLGLPSELLYEIKRNSANILKDIPSYDYEVKWTSTELMQLAAHRFNLCLEIFDPEIAQRLNYLDLSKKDDVREFWASFFPNQYVNRYEFKEDVLTYLLRHTHLLPRQLLLIMSNILVKNKQLTNGYRRLLDESVLYGVEKSEEAIALQIFKAFGNVFPQAEKIGKSLFGNFPTVFSFDELERRWNRHAKSRMSQIDAGFEMTDLTEMLLRMGIIGVVDENEETDLYFVGEFAYYSVSPANPGPSNEFSSASKLCLHPLFSRHFKATLNSERKAILPKGVVF